MAVNKVVMNTENGAETLIDLTKDSVTPETLHEGETAHNSAGVEITGTFTLNPELTEQESLILQIKTAVEDKSSEIETRFDKILTNKLATLASETTSLRDYACYALTSLKTVNLPNITKINTQTFRACTQLYEVNTPKATSIGSYAFYTCSKLAKADFPLVTNIDAAAFGTSATFATLILRANTVAKLANTNAFSGTPIANGAGYIYVPSALVDSYKTATNWSTYANKIRAIEDYPDICG